MANQSVTTLGTIGGPLPLEAQSKGFTHRWTVNYDDINNAAWTTDGDTVTVTLGTLPTEFLVDKCAVYVETAFTTDGTLTISVGTDGDVDNFLDAQDAKTAGPIVADTGATVKTETGSIGSAGDVLVAQFATQAATGAPSDISAGKLHILLGIVDVAALCED